MTKIIFTLLISTTISFIACGQNLKSPQIEDSSLSSTQQQDTNIQYAFPLLSLKSSFDTIAEYYPLALNQSYFLQSPTPSWKQERALDIAEIWKAGLAKDEELKTLRLMLGYVQVGGVAYLAYKHLKKYGLR